MDKKVNDTTVTTRIGIDKVKRAKSAEILNALLADASDLTMQCKHAHWNVAGRNFIALHELFDKLYEAAGGHVDQLAERAAALGSHVHGRLQDANTATRLPKFPDGLKDDIAFVTALADSFGKFSNLVRAAIDETEDLGDKVTSDMLNAIDGETDKHLWFLEAHLRAPH